MKYFAVLFLFCSLNCFAQGEANFWYFGLKAGLDFNSGAPIVKTDGQLQTFEGNATISDASGKLLFYTDGITIYNKNHTVMLNGTGLWGDPSTTQSATIVPKPGSTTEFYVFTIDAEAKPHGLSYSIVDMSLAGGLGAVTTRNVFVKASMCEKISVVKNADKTGFWVLTHLWNTNTFEARLLTAAGLSGPVTTNIGDIVTSTNFITPGVQNVENSLGYMKFSPDGTKVAACNYGDQATNQGSLQLFDFNNVTGTLSNAKTLMSNQYGLYGLEFSPNGKVLYATLNKFGKLYQFDLTAPNIAASRVTLLDSPTKQRIAALQLAPDKKIYIATFTDPFLGIINNPNELGAAANLNINGLDLGTISYGGLPTFNQSIFFDPTIYFKKTCLGDMTEFELIADQDITTVTWDFGDGTPPQTVLNNNKVTHQFNTAVPGIYTVKATNVVGTYATNVVPDLSASVEIFKTTATAPVNRSFIQICDNNNNGLFRFDLTLNSPQILNGQDPAKFTIRYFENAARYAANISIADPAKYTNLVAYQSQTIYAEVTNSANPLCKATTTFDIDVFDSPSAAPIAVSKLIQCDDTSVGTAADGFALFDLTQRNTELLSTQIPKPGTTYVVSFYSDAALTNLINNPSAYPNVSKAQTIYAKIYNQDNPDCFVPASFTIEVTDIPFVKAAQLYICDTDNDGFALFNLADAKPAISTDYLSETIDFFETLSDAQSGTNMISAVSAYSNKKQFRDTEIYARTSNGGCFNISQVTLNVAYTKIPASFSREFSGCDDDISGTKTDGISTFDFSSVTAEIENLFPGQLHFITYYTSQIDADAKTNAIANIASFRNTASPNQQNIYVRVENQLNSGCYSTGNLITLKVIASPSPTVVSPVVYCKDSAASPLTATGANLLWYTAPTAGPGSSLAPVPDTATAGSTTYYVSQTINGCESARAAVTVTVLPLPLAPDVTTPVRYCQNNMANPLTATGTSLLWYSAAAGGVGSNVSPTPTTSTVGSVYYYVSQSVNGCEGPRAAIEVITSLTPSAPATSSPVLYCQDEISVPLTATGLNLLWYSSSAGGTGSPNAPVPDTSKAGKVTYYVSQNNGCEGPRAAIEVVVDAAPLPILPEKAAICLDSDSNTLVSPYTITTGMSAADYSFQWFSITDGNYTIISGATSDNYLATSVGNYAVIVTNKRTGCESKPAITQIDASYPPKSIEVVVPDYFASPMTVTVNVKPEGNYQYRIDDGTYQDSNVFDHIPSGIRSITVREKNNCGEITEDILIINYPKFFTPNGDGYNDTWNIFDLQDQKNSIIAIFDRYGKLITEITPAGSGWDGTYNGHMLPSSDYWFVVHYTENNTEKIFKSHFSLKR
ncbi:T9SS type B sorting domain-containing protein [Flavobacterium sp. 3-210]